LCGVEDSYDAYCLDEAIAYFGNEVTSRLERVDGKDSAQIERKQQRILTRLLGDEQTPSRGQFNDPSSFFGLEK